MMVGRAPPILVSFHPAAVLSCGGLNVVHQPSTRTEAIGRLPRPVEAVMNTPSHHRVDHGRNARVLGANHAGVFIVRDRLSAPACPSADERPDFGLVRDLGPFTPLRVAFHEWVAPLSDGAWPGLTLRERAMDAAAPPGWSHDGARMTSRRVKDAHLARTPEDAGTPGF